MSFDNAKVQHFKERLSDFVRHRKKKMHFFNKKALFPATYGEKTGKSAILRALPGPAVPVEDRCNNPRRCSGQPEAAASGPLARRP